MRTLRMLSRSIYRVLRGSFHKELLCLPSEERSLSCLSNPRSYCQTVSEVGKKEAPGELLHHKQPIKQDQHAPHKPVMVDEVLQYLAPSSGRTYVDMTFGAGGHSTRILDSAPDIKLFALDRDPVAHRYAHELSKKYPDQVVPLLGKFSDLPKLLTKHKIGRNMIDGFLFDFGCSSMQFNEAGRGFSISKNGPLDMRMNRSIESLEPSAADILERIEERDLVRVLRIYGEEKSAKKIARAIINARYTLGRINTTHELAELVNAALGEIPRMDKLGRFAHNATKTFQAIRILVNNELNEINYGMILAGSYLKSNGRLITISFHSLEDTIVKRHVTGNIDENMANKLPTRYASRNVSYDIDELKNFVFTPWRMMHKHVLLPTSEEVKANPRARSAKFRAVEKMK